MAKRTTRTAPQRLGANIRAARQAAERSVSDAAREIGVNEQTWYRWERGATEPDLATLRRIAEVLGTTASELMVGA